MHVAVINADGFGDVDRISGVYCANDNCTPAGQTNGIQHGEDVVAFVHSSAADNAKVNAIIGARAINGGVFGWVRLNPI